MDSLVEPGVSEITILKPTQIGGSESLRNMIGWIIDNDPSPVLLVLPDEKSATEVISKRIRPLFDSCPALKAHLSPRAWDNTKYHIKTDAMTIDVGWSGSAQSLASKEIRFVFCDEEDKYAHQAGDEADAISLARERTRTYLHRARVVHLSTPSTRLGNIWRAWSDAGDKRRYHVPCPHCGKYQVFSFPQLKCGQTWPDVTAETKAVVADDVLLHSRAYYECIHCRGRIEDRHKNTMLLRGRWASDGQAVTPDGLVEGVRPFSKRIGFALNCFYSPWITFSEIAYRWIMCKGDPVATLNFRNSWLAEPYEDIVTKPKSSLIREKAFTAGPPDIVPAWATTLIVSVDVQKEFFWFLIRAWGFGWKSKLIRLGQCRTFDEVYSLLDLTLPMEGGRMVRPNVQVIDTGGNRTDEVYKYALRDVGRIVPIKGSGHKMRQPWSLSKLPNGVPLRIVDVDFYKDMTQRLIEDADPQKWQPYANVSEEYCLQMASEQKVIDRKTNRMIWVPITQGAANHAFDLETYSTFAADAGNVGLVQSTVPQAQRQPEDRGDFLSREGSDFLGTGGGYAL